MAANTSARKNAAVFTNAGTFHNGNITSYPGAFANFHIFDE